MPEQRTILVAGASGFIGRRLIDRLLSRKEQLRCVARRPGDMPAEVETLAGDLQDPAFLASTLEGVDTAYYLVHSLAAGSRAYPERDREIAAAFAAAGREAGLQRLIYLSGLGEGGDLSSHLRSRQEVAEVLREGFPPTTVLRAAIIIGRGGASYELLRFLVKTQPVLPEFRGLETRCQPIAVADVITYLAGCLDEPRTAGQSFDIGGPEILTYRQMLDEFAAVADTTNLYLPVPIFLPRPAAGLLGLLSAVDADLAEALLEGVDNEVVCTENRIHQLIPQTLTSYAEAVRSALAEESGSD